MVQVLFATAIPVHFVPALSIGALAFWGSACAFSGKPLSSMYPGERVPVMQKLLEKIGWSPFANIRDAILSPKPPNGPLQDWHAVRGGQLSGAVVRQVDAMGAFGVNADFTGADLYGSNFADSDLRGAMFIRARLVGATFDSADLRDAKFYETNLNSTRFRNANLQGADFLGSRLDPDNIRSSRNWTLAYYDTLSKLKLPRDHNDRVRRKDFSDYDFKELNVAEDEYFSPALGEADFSSANLQRANLERAILENADLSGADLRGAILRGADLSLANLQKTDLRGVDLTASKGLTLAQINSAITDNSTQLPGYLQRQIAFGQNK
jgi:uncharacterized protein YjbI with pentapeptide repeats